MTIALIAHDSKKELMVQFCTAYCRILSQHKLAMFAYNYLVMLVDRVVNKMEARTMEFMDLLNEPAQK